MHLYLTKQESEILQDAAEMLGTTQAYVMRLLLRDTAGLPIGGKGVSELDWLRETRCGHVQNLTGAG